MPTPARASAPALPRDTPYECTFDAANCRRSAFLKYHRGHFFGFKVEIRGRWWCPYTVWLAPDDPMSNPIIRHATIIGCPAAAGPGGRRNTYLMPKLPRPAMNHIRNLRQSGLGAVKQLWRGESFFVPEAPHRQRNPTSCVPTKTFFRKAWHRLSWWAGGRDESAHLPGPGTPHASGLSSGLSPRDGDDQQKTWARQKHEGGGMGVV